MKDLNPEFSISMSNNIGSHSINLDPRIAMIGLTLSRYHYEAGTISMSDFTNFLIKEIGLIIKPYTETFFHLIECYENMLEVEGVDNPNNASLIKDDDHSIVSQEDFEEKLRTMCGIEYIDIYDTDVVIREVVNEAIDDPEFMSYYFNALHKGDKDIFSSLRRLAEDNPEEFMNILFDRELTTGDTPAGHRSEKIDEEHLITWLSFYSILRAILKGSEPYQEALELKLKVVERGG